MKFPSAIQESGPFPNGRLRPVGVVCHRTFGARDGDLAVARGSRPPVGFHFYVTKRGEVFQFYDTAVLANHAKGANSNTIGIEVESRNNDDSMTDDQVDALRGLVLWIHENHDIPLEHITPPRTGRRNGFIDHAAVSGSDHSDLWHPHEWEAISAPEDTPIQEDNMQMIANYKPDNAVHFFYVADGGALFHAFWPRTEPFGRRDEPLFPDLRFDGQPSVTVDPDNKIHVICDRPGANPPAHLFRKPADKSWAMD